MKKLWIVLFTICFLFCGCDAGYNRHSAGASDYLSAVSVVQCGVPYVGYVDLRLDQIELLETDDYGRNLFLYRMASSQESFLLITQKVEDSLIYYYENDCSTIYAIDETDNEEKKRWLKELNDWNLPTEDRKMTPIDFTLVSPDHENITNYLDACEEIQIALESAGFQSISENTKIQLNGLEFLMNGGQVILVGVYSNDTKKYYIALYDDRAETAVVAIEPIAENMNFRESIIQFKEGQGDGSVVPSDEPKIDPK